MLRQAPDGWRKAVAKRESLDVQVVRLLSRDSSWEVREVIANRRDVPHDCAEQLARDGHKAVRHRVAFNEAVAAEVRLGASERQAVCEDVKTRCYAAHSQSLVTEQTRKRLAADPEQGVRSHVARRSDLSQAELRTLLSDREDFVQQAAASNPLVIEYQLGDVLDLTNPSQINGLLHNAACPDDLQRAAVLSLFSGLGADPNWNALDDSSYVFKKAIDALPDGDQLLVDLATNVLRWRDRARSKKEWRDCEDILRRLVRAEKLPSEVHEHVSKRSGDLRPSNLPDTVPGTFDSPPEEAFWLTVREMQLSALQDLVPQYKVQGYRLDFAIPKVKLGIEVDGLAYHSGQDAFQKDRERQRQLEMQGWRILRFTAREVQYTPEQCVRQADEWVRACQGEAN